jgi:lysophospholipase L1-like esterase
VLRQTEDAKTHGGFSLVFVGDSITQNYEKTGPAPDEAFAPIWSEFYGDRRALNLGYSGDQTQNVLWRLNHGEVEGISPKAVVVLIGTNNSLLNPQWSAEENAQGVEAVVADLRQRLPQAKILLLALLPSDVSPRKSAMDSEANALLARKFSGDVTVTWLDIGDIFRKAGALDTTLFYDTRLKPLRGALHLDTEAQRMMAAAIEPALSGLLGDRSRVPVSTGAR